MISEKDEVKRFEDWEDCDCNMCERYWDSSCDGVKKGDKKPCNQFLATRSVVIPNQIEELRKQVELLTWGIILVATGVMIHIVGVLFR